MHGKIFFFVKTGTKAMCDSTVAQVPAGSAKPKLILHFDVNETIMLGDPAGGDTLVDSLNKIVCKNAYVLGSDGNPSNSLPTHWYDGSHINSNPPPLFTGWSIPQGAVAYYRAGRAVDPYKKTFTENGAPGEAYRFAYNDMKAALLWPTGKDATSPDHRLCHDGVHHFLIPAFFHTIFTLAQQGRSFGVVIRTFGSDADDVANAINAFAEGKHLSSIPPGGITSIFDTSHPSVLLLLYCCFTERAQVVADSSACEE